MRPRALLLTAALVIAGCSEPDSTAQPAAPSPSPSPTPYVTPSFPPEPTPAKMTEDPVGGQFCTEIKTMHGKHDPLDPDKLIALGKLGEGAKDYRIVSQGRFVRESAERAKAEPGAERQRLLQGQVDRAGEECLSRFYYTNPTRR